MIGQFQLSPEMLAYFNKLVNLPHITQNPSAVTPSINPSISNQQQVPLTTPRTKNAFGFDETPHNSVDTTKEPFIGDKNWDQYSQWEYDKDVLQKQNPGMSEADAEHILTSRHGKQVEDSANQQIQSPLNSEVSNQLMQDFADWRKKTESFPQPYNPKTGENLEYKPSRLRTILGNVAGTLGGITSLNPGIGFDIANTIKQQPYNQAMQRYATSLTPYEQRMQQEAELAGISAKNFYDFLRALSAINTSNAAVTNAESQKRLSFKPTIGTAHPVIKPGQTQATEVQPMTSFNTKNEQWETFDRELGMSPTETPGERFNLAKYRETQENQRALLGRLSSQELANIHELNERDRLRISIAAQLRGDLQPSEQNNILKQIILKHPDWFKPDDKGNITGVKKEKQADYQLALISETEDQLIQANDSRVRILDLLEKSSKEKNSLILSKKNVKNSTDKIYTIQDPSSQQTYDFQLNHSPSYDESIQLIKREQLRRHRAISSQLEKNERIEQESQLPSIIYEKDVE